MVIIGFLSGILFGLFSKFAGFLGTLAITLGALFGFTDRK